MKKSYLILLILFSVMTTVWLSACGNKNPEAGQKEEIQQPTIMGYWERTAGGDYDPRVAMILGFLPDGQVEQIVLYNENSKTPEGYRKKSIYTLDHDNILHVWEESNPINELTNEKLVFGGMTFKKVEKEDVVKRISKMADWEEVSE